MNIREVSFSAVKFNLHLSHLKKGHYLFVRHSSLISKAKRWTKFSFSLNNRMHIVQTSGGNSGWFWQGVPLTSKKPYPKLSTVKKNLTRNYPRSFRFVNKIQWNWFSLKFCQNFFHVTQNLRITTKIQPEICAKMQNIDPKSVLNYFPKTWICDTSCHWYNLSCPPPPPQRGSFRLGGQERKVCSTFVIFL